MGDARADDPVARLGVRVIDGRRRVPRTVFPLVETKLAPPRHRPGIVPRTSLVDRLLAARSSRVIALVAPPGYGKTTLLGQWAARDERRFAWVTLDGRDNDPLVLLTYLAAAIDRFERVDSRAFELLATPGAPIASVVPAYLAAAWSVSARPIVLVLDDVHVLQQPECLDAIVALADLLPAGSQIALAGRGASGLPLGRWRARGELLEVDSRALALDTHEAAALLRGAGVELAGSHLGDLVRRTEGWPAGLYLAALSIRSRGPDQGDPVELSGTDRFVGDFFRTELLHGLSPSDLEFLTRTSILTELRGPLCDAILEAPGSQERLEEIERSNLFVVGLDRRRESYRYHALFRDLLLAELQRREPALVGDLHLRAATWLEAHGMTEAAIDHRFAADDVDGAARIIGSVALPAWYGGRDATVSDWFGRFDDDQIAGYGSIAIQAAWVALLSGDPVSADRLADAAERASRPDGDDVAGDQHLAGLSMLRAVMCRNGAADMMVNAHRGVELVPVWDPWRANSLLMAGSAHLIAGDDGRADDLFAEAVKAAARSGATSTGAVALAERALIAMSRGDWRRAGGFADASLAIVDEAHLEHYTVSVIAYVVASRVALHRAQPVQARANLARCQVLRTRLSYALPWFSVHCLLELARVYLLAVADPAGARTVLSEAAAILARRPDLGVLGDQIADLQRQVAAIPRGKSGVSTLTNAEMRLLPLLPTHLSFREIATRLFVSHNTVKTQAISVYGKLGVSSRTEAVTRAVELGLLERGVLAADVAGIETLGARESRRVEQSAR